LSLVLRELEPLALTPGIYAFVTLLGLLWGSFANVCIYRWPQGKSVVAPPSHCSSCQTPIRWYDNMPLVSWLLLRGKCRACGAKFSGRYLIVEALTGLLFALAWWFTMSVGTYFEPFDHRLIRFAIYAAFCFVMVVVAFIDIDHKLILDKLTLPSIAIFYGLSFLLPDQHWYDGLVGAVIGYGLPWTIGEVYWLIANRDGLGLGDSKLLAVIGALLGARGVVASLFGGAVLGAVIGVFVLMRGTGSARKGAVFAVGAVASVAVAAYGALTNHVAIGTIGSVLALAALVLARRFEPAPAEEPAPVAEQAPEAPLPGKELGARILALVAGVLVLSAVTFELIGQHEIAFGAGLLGVGLLLAAKRMVPVDETPAEPMETPEEPAASLMRTELPFGPFLALAAVFYLFAEPWILVNFHLPGG
jgi:leader peptidase (prepilin peptidase)/N-methyltransferase